MNQSSEFNPLGFTTQEKRIFGFVYMGVILINVLPYAVVIWIFFKNNIFKNMAYHIMGHFGINQLCLQFTYFLVAIMCIFNSGFGDLLNKGIAVFNSGNWNGSIYFILLLSFKRLEVLTGFMSYFIINKKSQEIIFQGLIYFGHLISLSWIIVYSFPEMGMQIQIIYFIFETKNSEYDLHKVQEIYAISCIAMSWVFYLISFLALLKERMTLTTNQQFITPPERNLLIQSILICVFKTFILIYTYNFLAVSSKFQYFLLKFINVYEQGYTAYLYLIFNKSLRNEFLRSFGMKKHKLVKVDPMTINKIANNNAKTMVRQS